MSITPPQPLTYAVMVKEAVVLWLKRRREKRAAVVRLCLVTVIISGLK